MAPTIYIVRHAEGENNIDVCVPFPARTSEPFLSLAWPVLDVLMLQFLGLTRKLTKTRTRTGSAMLS